MEKIISYLKDPAWWFTAVFIAILASLAAYSRYRKTILKRVNKNAQQDATPDAQALR